MEWYELAQDLMKEVDQLRGRIAMLEKEYTELKEYCEYMEYSSISTDDQPRPKGWDYV